MLKKITLTLASLLVLSSCTPVGEDYRPYIYNGNAYTGYHLSQCQSYAKNYSNYSRNVGYAAGGSVLGAAGFANASAGSHTGEAALVGLLLGALAGLGEAANANNKVKESIIVDCLQKMGYSVVSERARHGWYY